MADDTQAQPNKSTDLQKIIVIIKQEEGSRVQPFSETPLLSLTASLLIVLYFVVGCISVLVLLDFADCNQPDNRATAINASHLLVDSSDALWTPSD